VAVLVIGGVVTQRLVFHSGGARVHALPVMTLPAPESALVLNDSTQAAMLADPVCRAEIARMAAADEGWALLLRHLGEMGPSLAEDVQRELDLRPKELKALRSPLERCGAIVSRFFQVGDDWVTELVRWDHLLPEAARDGGLEELVVAGVRAAVICPEREPKRWFSWTWRFDDGLLDRLVDEGRLVRPEPGWLSIA